MSWIDIKALNEKRNKAIADAGLIRDAVKKENREFTAEEDVRFKELHAEADKCKSQIENLQTQERAEKTVAEMLGREEDGSKATVDKRAAFRGYLKRSAHLPLSEMEQRALDASAMIPEGFHSKFVEILSQTAGPIQAGCEVISTQTGGDYPYSRFDDSSNTGELIAVNTEVAYDDDTVIDNFTLGAYIFSSKAVKVPRSQVVDVAFDIENLLTKALAQRVTKALNTYLTTGTGSSQPQGVVTGASSGKVVASPTAITYNEMLDLIHSLRSDYRDKQKAKLMFNDSTLLVLRKLVDGNGNPLWNAGNVAAGHPDTFAGYSYVENPHMADIGAGTKPILFGNFEEGYVVRTVKDVELMYLYNWLPLFQDAWVAHFRADGKVKNSAALKYLQMAAS